MSRNESRMHVVSNVETINKRVKIINCDELGGPIGLLSPLPTVYAYAVYCKQYCLEVLLEACTTPSYTEIGHINGPVSPEEGVKGYVPCQATSHREVVHGKRDCDELWCV